MNGYKTKYYKYKNTSGKITISPAIAEALNWKHGDEITIMIETGYDNKGLFLFKERKAIESNKV